MEALSVTVKEVVLGSMKISVKLPGMVRVNNVGAIFIANDITTLLCMKHVGIRYKSVNKYVRKGVIKTIFMKSAENDCDILTKNLYF